DDIDGATDSTYLSTEPGALTVVLTATNTEGSDSLESDPVTVTEAIPDAPVVTSPGTITGTGKIGDAHTVSGFTYTGTGTLAYQWRGNGWPISGATSAGYTPVAADDGTTLTRTTTGTNAGGSDSGTTPGVAITYNAPVAGAGPFAWLEAENTGSRTYDAKTLFSVAGDASKFSLTFALSGTGGGATFESGVFEDGVFE